MLQGGYWYLDTRPEEFESIGSEWARLKGAAAALDWRVKGGGSGRFRTLLHGDFKAANILHSTDSTRCAAYDFQYVGEGYGVRDVVMLLHSSLQRGGVQAEKSSTTTVTECFTGLPAEKELLQHYHAALLAKLGARQLGDRRSQRMVNGWSTDGQRMVNGWSTDGRAKRVLEGGVTLV
eukprot:1189304-Prorocentrum_minimum.AAC.1